MANISCTELCRTLHLALGIVKVRSYTISVHFRIRPDGYNVLYITVRVSHMQIWVIKIGQNRAWKHGFGGLGRLQMLIINQNRILFYQTKIFLFFFNIFGTQHNMQNNYLSVCKMRPADNWNSIHAKCSISVIMYSVYRYNCSTRLLHIVNDTHLLSAITEYMKLMCESSSNYLNVLS